MNEYESKLGGFSKFRETMKQGSAIAETQSKMSAPALSAGFQPSAKPGMQIFGKGTGKGMNAGGPEFAPNATQGLAPAEATPSAMGKETYESNKGPMKQAQDNVTNNAFRGTQNQFGSGANNQRSFAKQPEYGQKDLSHLESNQKQKGLGTTQVQAHRKTIGSGQFADCTTGAKEGKKHIGKGLVTAELFGKTSEKN